MSFCTKTFTMAQHFKANAVGEKKKERVEELEDNFKEVMGEPSTEPFGTPKGKIGPLTSALLEIYHIIYIYIYIISYL